MCDVRCTHGRGATRLPACGVRTSSCPSPRHGPGHPPPQAQKANGGQCPPFSVPGSNSLPIIVVAPSRRRLQLMRSTCDSFQNFTSPNTPTSSVLTFCTCGGTGRSTVASPFSCLYTAASLKPLVTVEFDTGVVVGVLGVRVELLAQLGVVVTGEQGHVVGHAHAAPHRVAVGLVAPRGQHVVPVLGAEVLGTEAEGLPA